MRERKYISTEKASEYLDFPNVGAFHDFLYRRRKAGFPVRCFHRGRILKFLESDLDAAMQLEERRPLRAVRLG